MAGEDKNSSRHFQGVENRFPAEIRESCPPAAAGYFILSSFCEISSSFAKMSFIFQYQHQSSLAIKKTANATII